MSEFYFDSDIIQIRLFKTMSCFIDLWICDKWLQVNKKIELLDSFFENH